MNKTLEALHADMVSDLLKPAEEIVATITLHKANLIHACMGISGEAGELLDAIKKTTMYNLPLDVVNVVEELGDIEFYMEALRSELSLSRNYILQNNMNKLSKRYSNGSYSDTQARDRADKKEAEEFILDDEDAPKFSDGTPKILILGYARHGKDTFAEKLVEASGNKLSFASSSEFVAEAFIFDELAKNHGLSYLDVKQCFEDRVNHRELWHKLIKDYNSPDKTRLSREIVAVNDIYVGMRCIEEYKAAIEADIFDYIYWVAADDRIGKEAKSSMTIKYCDTNMIYIDNNGDEDKLTALAKELWEIMQVAF